jgi:general secretion pathway protein I
MRSTLPTLRSSPGPGVAAPPGAGALRRAGAGFTLIEVVVAVAVVALGLAAAFSSITRTAAFTTRLQERTLATWIAQNRIVEFRLQPAAPEVGRSDGDVEFAGQDWVWNAEVIATQVETLRRVEVEVRHDDGGPVMGTAVGFVSTLPQAGVPRPWTGTPAAADGPGQAPPGIPDRGGRPGATPDTRT